MKISEIKADIEVDGFFLIFGKIRKMTKKQSPYLEMVLQDNSGQITARLWDTMGEYGNRVKRYEESIENGRVSHVRGRAESFAGSLQINITDIKPASDGEYSREDMLESSKRPLSGMVDEFDSFIAYMGDSDFKKLLTAFRESSEFEMLKISPAAKVIHHAFIGGLLEHSLSMARAARCLEPNYPALDWDLIVMGCFFHDIGKIFEISPDPGFEYTVNGRLKGHIFMGARLIEELIKGIDGFPEDKTLNLIHLILSHQGDREEGWGSVADPATPEAITLHFLDNMDAKIQNALYTIGKETGEGVFTNPKASHIGKIYYRRQPPKESASAEVNRDKNEKEETSDGASGSSLFEA